MATPAESRAALVQIAESAKRELVKLWALVEDKSAVATRDFLMDVIPALADKYGLAAGALAADWYDEVRESAGAAGHFLADVAAPPGPARYEALVRWGVDPLFGADPTLLAAQARVSAGLGKIVTNLHGQTLTEATERDPAAQGWSRWARADGCNVCKTLAGRGMVYKKATADFATHDWCNCVAVPKFGEVKDVRDYERTKRYAVTEEGERRRKEGNQALKQYADDEAK